MVLFVQIFKLRASGISLALTQWLGLLLFVNRSSLEKNFTFGYAKFPMSQDILMFFTAVNKWVNSTEKRSHVWKLCQHL